MSRALFPCRLAILLPLLALLLLPVPSVGSAEYEQPYELSARTILTPEQIRGPYHTVNDTVRYDGFFYRYTVTSPFGTFQAGSNTALNILIHELGAITAMKEVSTEAVAVDSLKESGKKTVTGLKNLFTEPMDTLGNAAEGASDLFSRAQQVVGRRETTDAEDSKAAQFIGFTKSKGEIASKYGVSLFSRNPVLQEELDRLATADYLGGISIGVATGAVSGGAGLMLTTSGAARLLNDVINNTPPSKLWLQNKNKLMAMGIDEDLVEFFLNNPVFTPALHTILVDALDGMKGVANRGIFVKIGLQASNPDMASTITSIAVLAAGYHKHVAPLKSLAPLARVARGIRKDGATVILLSTDHLIWNQRIAGLVTDLTAAARASKTGLELWTLGTLSDTTRTTLQENGWKTYENARNKLIPLPK